MLANKQASEQQNPDDVFTTLIHEKLSTTLFMTTPEQRKHLAYLQSVQRFLSIVELSGQLENYKRLVKLSYNEPMTLMEASYFLNGCNRLRPNDIGMIEEEYVQLIERNDQIVIEWNKIVTPMKTATMKEVMTKMQKNILMPEEKKIILPN